MKTKLIAAFLAIFATTSYAAFVNESTDNPFETTTQIKIFGATNAKGFDSIRGMGRDQPLSEAVTQIVPKTYTVRTVGIERWYGLPVTWKGGKEWPDVLREALAATPEIIAEIEADSKVMTLRARNDSKAAEKTVTQTDLWEARVDDRTVKGMITRWAKIANWQVYWENSVDYPIIASANITGRFEEAVEKVIKSMQGAQTPPRAVFYENRVLRITSRGVE